MAVRLFVGNLPYDANEGELREFFLPVGTLSYVHFPVDRETGRPRGFAFVEFEEREKAEEAISRFNNQLFRGRPLAINEARARDASAPPRPAGGFGPRPGGGPPRSFGPRPPLGGWSPEPVGERKPSRNFGPDAPPRGKKRFAKSPERGERAPKGPIKERGGGRFYGIVEDEDFGQDDLSIDNIATRAEDGAGDEEA